jgi:hypothetical protein
MHPYSYTPDDINATLFQELRLETHPDILCEAETITNLALHTFRRVRPLPLSLCVGAPLPSALCLCCACVGIQLYGEGIVCGALSSLCSPRVLCVSGHSAEW